MILGRCSASTRKLSAIFCTGSMFRILRAVGCAAPPLCVGRAEARTDRGHRCTCACGGTASRRNSASTRSAAPPTEPRPARSKAAATTTQVRLAGSTIARRAKGLPAPRATGRAARSPAPLPGPMAQHIIHPPCPRPCPSVSSPAARRRRPPPRPASPPPPPPPRARRRQRRRRPRHFAQVPVGSIELSPKTKRHPL